MVSYPHENGSRADLLEAQMIRLPQVLRFFGNHPRSLHIRNLPQLHLHNQKQVQPIILSEQSICHTLLPKRMPPVNSPTQTQSFHRTRLPHSHHFQYICGNSPQQHTQSRDCHCHILEPEEICQRRNTLIAPKSWGTSHSFQPKSHRTDTVYNQTHKSLCRNHGTKYLTF